MQEDKQKKGNGSTRLFAVNTYGFDSGDGSFADPTAQKNSPNRELQCVAPKSTGLTDASVVGRRESDITDTGNRQVYPRTKTLYG